MSDKFFFKGRQDARQSHIKYGFKENNVPTSASKKPLLLTVTNETRKREVEALAADVGVKVEVNIDTQPNAKESIEALLAFVNKGETVIVDKTPARNDPCLCGSGKKFKKCCA